MLPVRIDQLARRLGASMHAVDADALVSGFAWDSRSVKKGDLFLAIRGANVDGHDFTGQAIEHGSAACLVERAVFEAHLQVPNLVEALAKMAATYREEFSGPVVGVTGSAGKTSTKEMIAAALAPLGKIAKTTGNRNTEFTAPLMWAEIEDDHAAVVVEMSMRGFGQIAHLANFSQPTIGVITNIGHNHLEKVGSRQGIAEAKGELLKALPSTGVAVLWAEDDFVDTLRDMAPCKVETFGWSDSADLRISAYRPVDWSSSQLSVSYRGHTANVEMGAVGRHLALNAAAAVLAAIHCGVDLESAAQAVSNAEMPEMRMQPIPYQGAVLLLDYYNAAPQSFVAAIETLMEMPVDGRRIVVAGEMKELGSESEPGHREVGRALAEANVDCAIFFGVAMNDAADEARKAGLGEDRIIFAKTHSDVIAALSRVTEGDAVLIKGSRAMELEKAVEPLLAVSAK
jgi:UDP-N-acetylmuramoyl-tripeptide--D-alanyl-D-alanine ligase